MRQAVLSEQIQSVTPYILCRNNRTQFYESKALNGSRIDQSEPQILSLALVRWVPDVLGTSRTPKPQIGLLPAIAGSILTALLGLRSQARYISKTGQRYRELSVRENIRTLRLPMLQGLVLTSVLVLLEISLRDLFL